MPLSKWWLLACVLLSTTYTAIGLYAYFEYKPEDKKMPGPATFFVWWPIYDKFFPPAAHQVRMLGYSLLAGWLSTGIISWYLARQGF
jgi:hypothetical protein